MSFFSKIIFACLLCMLAAGCAISGTADAWVSTLREQVKPGMSHQEVASLLGEPIKTSAMPPSLGAGGQGVEMWIYSRPKPSGYFRLVFDQNGRFLYWYTWFSDTPLTTARASDPYEDIAHQLRDLRMERSRQRFQP